MAPDTGGQALSDIAVQLLGNELRRRREERGWTREDLVERLFANTGQQISNQTICTYELGTRVMTVARLAVLCCATYSRPGRQHCGPLWTGRCTATTTGSARCYRSISARLSSSPIRVSRRFASGHASISVWGPHALCSANPPITNLATVCGVTVATITAALHSTRNATRTPKTTPDTTTTG
jgi:transcriptional regulator with XRE-family HTH domain